MRSLWPGQGVAAGTAEVLTPLSPAQLSGAVLLLGQHRAGRDRLSPHGVPVPSTVPGTRF